MGIASLPFALQKRIIEFLLTLPNLHDSAQQQAFLNSAGLDKQLQDRIRVADPPSQFFHLLVPLFSQYGTLEDGRQALQAILEAAKAYIGRDGQAVCESLIQELHAELNNAPAHSQNQPGTPRAAGKPAGVQFGNLSFGSVGGNVNVVQAGGDIHGDVIAGNNTTAENDRDDA